MKYKIDKINEKNDIDDLIEANKVIAKKKASELRLMKKKTALEREKQHQIALLNQEKQEIEEYESEEIRQKSNELKSVFNQINRDNIQMNKLKAEAEEMKRRNDNEKEIDSDKPLLEVKENDDNISPNISPKEEEESTLTPNMTIREERIEEMLYQKEYHEKMKKLGRIEEEEDEEESKESIKIEVEKQKNNTKSLDLPPDLYKV